MIEVIVVMSKLEIELTDLPHFQLSPDQNLTLLLIKRELQETKLINELKKIGTNGLDLGRELDVIILSLMGFKNRTDELWNWYNQTVELFAEKVDLRDDSTTQRLAFEFYIELKEKRSLM